MCLLRTVIQTGFLDIIDAEHQIMEKELHVGHIMGETGLTKKSAKRLMRLVLLRVSVHDRSQEKHTIVHMKGF